MKLTKPIALVGMMGAGKTSFGRKIAKKLNAQFFDSDAAIKLKTGYSPKEIFNYFGEAMLKETEFAVIEEICQKPSVIIATGDSTIDNKKAWDFLKQNTITIWLNIDLKVISARLKPNEDRPYLDEKQDESTLKFLTRLYRQRAQKYKQAHLTIHRPILNKKTFLKKLTQLINKLQENGSTNLQNELDSLIEMANTVQALNMDKPIKHRRHPRRVKKKEAV